MEQTQPATQWLDDEGRRTAQAALPHFEGVFQDSVNTMLRNLATHEALKRVATGTHEDPARTVFLITVGPTVINILGMDEHLSQEIGRVISIINKPR